METAGAEELRPGHRPYQPFGAALQLLLCRDPEVLISGPAGTGKSRACLEKLHLCAEKYPGMRGLIVRKSRESLTEAALFTFENKVVP
jgi:phage terminase large subunit